MITQLPREAVIAAAKQCLAQIQATRDKRAKTFLDCRREPGPKWLRRLLKLQPLSDTEVEKGLDCWAELDYAACRLAHYKQFEAATKMLRLAQATTATHVSVTSEEFDYIESWYTDGK
jgi:hypothetical protein